jgi:hypothetical protein
MWNLWYNGQATIGSILLGKRMRFSYGITKARLQTHTLRTCNIYCFSTAKVVTRTRIIVTLYLHCISSRVQKLFKFLATTNRLTSTYHTGSLVCTNSTAASAYANYSNGQVTQWYESPRIKLKQKAWSYATQLTWTRNKIVLDKAY